MNPERWQQIDDLFQVCLEIEVERRAAFLDEACSNDRALRESVEALLTSDANKWNFLEHPALDVAAPFLADDLLRLEPGQQIAHYEIVGLIGRGGMGEVYSAKDQILNRPIALKFLPADCTQNKDRLRRFQREAQAASALNHPNILTIHQLGDVDGQQFIATEFVEGETLRERLSKEPLTLANAIDITAQIASALNAAHKAGIVHRDIKPENIMLRPDGYVKVLDFGLAKLTEQNDLPLSTENAERTDASSGLLMGTVRYMSPEQAGGLQVDARSDIFSLGVVLYEMVTGCPPFAAKDNATLVESIMKDEPASWPKQLRFVPDKLVAIIARCLSKEREDRYQNAEHLLNDLKTLKSEFQVEASRSESPEGVQPWTRRTQSKGGAVTTEAWHVRGFPVQSISNQIYRPRLVLTLIVLSITGTVIVYTAYKLFRRPNASTVAVGNSPQTGTWTTRASISSPRADAEPAVLNGVLYVAGGWNVCTPFATLESYDSATDTWTQRAPMITARGNHGVAALNGLIYAVGGSTDCGVDTASVEAYDPKTNSWSRRAPLPGTRSTFVLAAVRGKLYAIGGESNRTGPYGLNTEYDPETDTWIERAPMPTPRSAAAVAVINDIVYVVGGGKNRTIGLTVEAYDPVKNSWSARAPVFSPRHNASAAVVSGVIYVFGGNPSGREVEAYDPATDKWSKVGQVPAPRSNFHAATLDGSIYFAGGFDGINYLSSTMTFTPGVSAPPRPRPCPSVGEWTTKTPMPTVRGTMAVGEVNGIIYVAGGQQGDSRYLATNEAYDPVVDKWIARAQMPTARSMRGTNSAVVNGIFYVIGGNSPHTCTNVNEAYDPVTDTWTTKASMPTARCHVAVAALNGLIYAIGGNTNRAFTPVVEVYNPTTDSWMRAPAMPTARQEVGVGVIDGILYAVGGFGQYGSLNILEAYDPATKTWTTKSPMPSLRNEIAAAVINHSLIVMGGESNEVPMAIVEAYDPSTDTWTSLKPMPKPRTSLSAVARGNTLYAFGGGDVPYFPGAVSTNEAFTFIPCVGK